MKLKCLSFLRRAKAPVSPRRFLAYAARALCALALGAGSLSAELLVHEPFDYERRQGYVNDEIPGEGIAGFNGGTGFAGSWRTTGSLESGIPEGEGDYGDGETYGIKLGARVAPLSYIDSESNSLITSGNQIRTAFGRNSWEKRDLAASIGSPGSTVWLSFLAQADAQAGSGRYAFVELAQWGEPWLWLGNVTPVSSGNWGYQVFSPTGAPHPSGDAGDAYPMDVQTMYLVKFEFPEDSWDVTQVSIWLNPDNLTDENALPAEPTLSFDVPYTEYNELGVAGRYSTDFDEIRIGTTFDSVTPSEVVEIPADPEFAIARDGDQIVLSWAAAATGYALYVSDDLATWTEVVETPVVQDDRNEVTLPTEDARKFYRLEK